MGCVHTKVEPFSEPTKLNQPYSNKIVIVSSPEEASGMLSQRRKSKKFVAYPSAVNAQVLVFSSGEYKMKPMTLNTS